MTVVTLRGFTPAETVFIYPFAVGELWARQMGQPPRGAPVANGVADANGTYSPDLPDNIEYLAYGATSKKTSQVMNAVTQGGSVPLVPAV
jgi:hypothetical protein